MEIKGLSNNIKKNDNMHPIFENKRIEIKEQFISINKK